MPIACKLPQRLFLLFEEGDHLLKSLIRSGGRETRLSPEIARTSADRAHEFRAAAFDPAVKVSSANIPPAQPLKHAEQAERIEIADGNGKKQTRQPMLFQQLK